MKRFTKIFSALLICICLVLPTLSHADDALTQSCAQQNHPLAMTHVVDSHFTPVDDQLHTAERYVTGACACGAKSYDEQVKQVYNEMHSFINGVCHLCGYVTATGSVTNAPATAAPATAAPAPQAPAATNAPAATEAPAQATPAPTAAPVVPKATVSTKEIKNADDANEVGQANIGHYLVVTSNCNVRADASASSARLGGAEAGARYLITGYKLNGATNIWYEIEFEERKGYIASGLVTIEANENAPVQQPAADEAQPAEAQPAEETAVTETAPVVNLTASAAVVGRYVAFGQYEQDGNLDNGKEPILWQVMDVNAPKGRMLLAAVNALDVMPYDEYGTADWQASTLRSWLNSDFCANAFTAEQQSALRLEYVADPFHTNQHTDAEKDLVFVLSQTEDAMFGSVTVSAYDTMGVYTLFQACKPSYYAAAKLDSSDACAWWLRDAAEGGRVMFAGEDGTVSTARASAVLAVRPAVWVDVASSEYAWTNAAAQTSDLNADYTVGASLSFGHDENGNMISWTIMSVDNDNGCMTVMADYAVAQKAMNAAPAAWSDTELRTWLNEDFTGMCFTDAELRVLLPMAVDADLLDYVTCPSVAQLDMYAGYWFSVGDAAWRTRYNQLLDPMHESFWFRDATAASVSIFDGWEQSVTTDFTQELGARPILTLDVAELMQMQ